ncbi:MAG: hypothetical protein ACREK2_01580 [Gemmatimonadota bacterium]
MLLITIAPRASPGRSIPHPIQNDSSPDDSIASPHRSANEPDGILDSVAGSDPPTTTGARRIAADRSSAVAASGRARPTGAGATPSEIRRTR